MESIAESIIKIVMYALGFAATRKIDAVIGKWVAWLQIAWEGAASAQMKASRDAAMADFKSKMAQNSSAWESWRKKVLPPSP